MIRKMLPIYQDKIDRKMIALSEEAVKTKFVAINIIPRMARKSTFPPDNCCYLCGETNFSPNIEAFEICGELTCNECADEVFEKNSQFGMCA